MALVVGIAGGSGSGKTTLAAVVAAALPAGEAVVVPADAYYRDLGHLPPAARALTNFDEPAALDLERLLADLRALRAGRGAARPVYDFATHTRSSAHVAIPPCAVVVLEGILVLAVPEVRDLCQVKVFVAASAATRLERRVARDVGERGRTRASVLAQFARHTEPMHARFVEPSRAWADLVVSGETPVAVESSRVVAHLQPLNCMAFRPPRD